MDKNIVNVHSIHMMPKYSKTPMRLKLIRKITKLTLGELAAKIGIKERTLGKIERCGQGLLSSNALLIGMATGSHPEWLMGKIGKSKKALDWYGKPYTLETYHRWDKGNKELTEKRPIEKWIREWRTTQLLYDLVQLCRLAGRRGKYEIVNSRLTQLIKRQADLFKLSDYRMRETIPFLADGSAAVRRHGSNSGKVSASRIIEASDVTDAGGYRESLTASQVHALKEGIAVAKSSYHDPSEIMKMQAALSPLFLFELGDLSGTGEWEAISNEITMARQVLDLLQTKLSKT